MKRFFIFYFIYITHFSYAQEVVSDLLSNPISNNNVFITNAYKSSVTLPFIDDFSYNSSNVDPLLWEKGGVFVNRSLPINPPTIGVATFDGLNEFGLARDFNTSNNFDPSDTLLSKKINLSNLTSVYLMFYYQAQGLGDSPELQDKLILEFLNDTLAWEQIWVATNDTLTEEFTKVVKVIDQSRFMHDDFQFRFRNYATITGNFDHWHLDYIKIAELLSASDTIDLNDLSFVYSSPSFLQRYSEMPWVQFLNNQQDELKDSIDIKLRNNNASTNVDYQFNVFENSNQIYHYPSIGISRNISVLDYDSIGNFSLTNPSINIESNIFSSIQPLSTSFIIQNIIGTANSDNKFNDTLYHIQNFDYHFSYDDGTAESAYGINTDGAKLAYEFHLNRPDTLRAVQMYFPQMLDSVNHIPFKLIIWNKTNGLPGDTLYSEIFYPIHSENGFYHTYYLSKPLNIIGSFYVGWEQTTNDLLNIGFDKNNVANNYMFYNIGAGWATSSFTGSWMIRPLFSENELLTNLPELKYEFDIYPNPAISEIFIKTLSTNNTISIYSNKGRVLSKLYTNSTLTKINIRALSSGVYFIEVLNDNSRGYKKMIIK